MRATLTDLRWRRTQDSAASCHTAAAIEIVRSWDPDREVEPAPGAAASAPIYVMFFDGGSCGNPGSCGSGAVIIRTDYHAITASIIWSAPTSLAHSFTTNNQAEYVGALEGLRAAHKHQWLPLEVVGDSQFILRQLMKYSEPRNGRLAALYAEARR
jgi:hypothetical protein